jgi:hypothetical protein
MGKNAKTLVFFGGCNFRKDKKLRFLSSLRFGTVSREVGGSNPLAPTIKINYLRLPSKVAVLVLWQDCGKRAILWPATSRTLSKLIYYFATPAANMRAQAP